MKKNIFWNSGDGSIRRDNNIEVVKDLIKSGLTYGEIIKLARRKFRSKTISEYYEIALDEISNSDEATEFESGEIKNSQKTEETGYSKYCKNCNKPIRNDLTFCSAKCIHEYKFKQKSSSENSESEESATDYMKRKKAEKEKTK